MGRRLFEELVVSNRRKRRSGYALPASIAMHAAVLSAVPWGLDRASYQLVAHLVEQAD